MKQLISPLLLLFALVCIGTVCCATHVPLKTRQVDKSKLFIYSGHKGEFRPYDLPKYNPTQNKRDNNQPYTLVYQDVMTNTGVGWDDPTLGEARRNCLEAAVAFHYDRLNPVPDHPTWRIFVTNATFSTTGTSVLADAGSSFYGDSSLVSYQPFSVNVVQTLLQQGIDLISSTDYHTNVDWNFGWPWFVPDGCGVQVNQLGGDNPGSSTDFFSVAVHELTHALGFLSKFSYGTPEAPYNPPNPSSAMQTYVPPSASNDVYPMNFQWDTDVLQGSSSVFALGAAAEYPNQYIGTADAALSNNLFNTGFFHHQLATRKFAIFAPSSYEPGSTFSHWEDLPVDYPWLVMKPALSVGALSRYWGLAEGGKIKDLLYPNVRAVNDECDAAHLVVYGSYSLSKSFTPTPSAAPTASTCDPFPADIWFVFVPFFDFTTTGLNFTFQASNGFAAYSLCTNTTIATQITCSSDSSVKTLGFQAPFSQIYIRANVVIANPGTLEIGITGTPSSSNVFPARATNYADTVTEMNQFRIPATGGGISFLFVPRITGYYSLYTVSSGSSTFLNYNNANHTATSTTGALSLFLTAETNVSLGVYSSPGAQGNLQIYEPVSASCYRAVPMFRLGRSSFDAKYLPPIQKQICSKTVYRTAWASFVASQSGNYTFSSCGSSASTILALSSIAPTCSEGSNGDPSLSTCPSNTGNNCATVTIQMNQNSKVFVAVGLLSSIAVIDQLPVITVDIAYAADPTTICSALPTVGTGVLDSPTPDLAIDGPTGYYSTQTYAQWKRFTACPGFNGSSWDHNYLITSINAKYLSNGGTITVAYALYLDPTFGGYPLANFQDYILLTSGTFTQPASGSSGQQLITLNIDVSAAWTEAGDIWLGLALVSDTSGGGIMFGSAYSGASFSGFTAYDSTLLMATGGAPQDQQTALLMNLGIQVLNSSSTATTTLPTTLSTSAPITTQASTATTSRSTATTSPSTATTSPSTASTSPSTATTSASTASTSASTASTSASTAKTSPSTATTSPSTRSSLPTTSSTNHNPSSTASSSTASSASSSSTSAHSETTTSSGRTTSAAGTQTTSSSPVRTTSSTATTESSSTLRSSTKTGSTSTTHPHSTDSNSTDTFSHGSGNKDLAALAKLAIIPIGLVVLFL